MKIFNWILKRLGTIIGGSILGIGMIFFGIVLLFIPVIGWLFGIIFIFMGIMMPIMAGIMGPATAGRCPRCNHRIVFKPMEKGTTCFTCHRRVLNTINGFELV